MTDRGWYGVEQNSTSAFLKLFDRQFFHEMESYKLFLTSILKPVKEIGWTGDQRKNLDYPDSKKEVYWVESWRAEETYCHSDSSEKPPVWTGVKNLQRVK